MSHKKCPYLEFRWQVMRLLESPSLTYVLLPPLFPAPLLGICRISSCARSKPSVVTPPHHHFPGRPPSLLATQIYVTKYGGRHHFLLNSHAICEMRCDSGYRRTIAAIRVILYISFKYVFRTLSHGLIDDDKYYYSKPQARSNEDAWPRACSSCDSI